MKDRSYFLNKKAQVYKYFSNGSLEEMDKGRLKPMTRIRNSVEDFETEGTKVQILMDWLSDISKGIS